MEKEESNNELCLLMFALCFAWFSFVFPFIIQSVQYNQFGSNSRMKLPLLLLVLFLYCVEGFTIRQVQVTASVTTINSISNYTFRFDRTTDNNFFATAFASQQVPTGMNGTVTITFPNTYTSISSATCLAATVNSLAVNSFNCSVSGNTVIFGNIFTSVSNLFVTGVIIMVGNIQNPSPAIASGSFSGTLGNDVSLPSNSSTNGVQLTPGFFQGCTITFSPGNVNIQPSSMRVSVTPSDPHPAGSTVIVQFPRSVWSNDISGQSLPITSAMSCSNTTSNLNSGIQCVGSSNFNFITVSNMLSTPTTANFGFAVANFLSPPSNQPSDAIVITSYSGSSRIDTCTVYPSGLIPNNFYSFTITPLTTFTVNAFVGLRFQMTLSMTINQADTLNVVFPNGTTFIYSNVFGTSFYSTPVITGQSVTVSSDPSVIGTNLQNTDYTISLLNFQAPPSTVPTNPIIFQIQRNGYPIMAGSASLTAVTAVLLASVSLASSTVWARTSYTFVINTSHPLSSEGMIQILFPSTVTLGTNISAVLLGIGVNSNPVCTINNASNHIFIASINGSTANIIGQSLTLTINGIINPPDTTTTGAFTIYTYYSSNLQGMVQTGAISGITATIGTIAFGTVSVIPSSYTVLQSSVSYTITFNNTYIIPVGGYIVLQIPLDIAIVMSSISTYCKLAFNGASYISTTCAGTTTGTYNQITFTQAAQTLPIAANTVISLRIDSLCTNPTNTRIISPFAIMTYSSTAAIESLGSGITVQMTTPAAFQVLAVSRVSAQNSALTLYTFTLMQQASLPNTSRLIITIPSLISMTVNSTCTDLSLNPLSCISDSYQALQVILPAIAGGVQFGVIISNIRNYASFQPINSSFSFITKTNDQISTFASGSVSPSLVNSVPSSFQQIIYSFSPAAYGGSELLTLSITPSIYIVPSSFIISLAPSFGIGSLTCSSFIGFTGTCSIMSLRTLNVTGILGTSKLTFSISGITSPMTLPIDYTIITSFDSGNNLIDQSSTDVRFGLSCALPCKTCNSNTSSCLSCYNNSNISQFNIYFPSNNTCVASCPSAYFQDTSTLTCFLCGSTCLTCSSTNSNCTSCNSNSTYPALSITNYNGACLSACPTLFYLSNTTTPMKCVSCVPPCQTCTGESICSSCISGNYYYGLTCSTSCPANISIANNATKNCDACSSTCATCSGTINNCITCSSTAALHNGQCVSQCPNPLVIRVGVCGNCDTSCKTCFSIYVNCTACYTNSSVPYLSVTNTSLGSCLESCTYTFYGDLLNGVCARCSNLPLNCNNCSSSSTCYDCNSGYILYNSQCLNYIPLGFYNNSGQATSCNSTCATCLNLANNCTSCVNLSLSFNRCIVNCPSGSVSVNLVCTACTYQNYYCFECYNLPTNCTSCYRNVTPAVYLIGGSCLSSCPNYTYADSSSAQCLVCRTPCQLCTSSSLCLSCVSNNFLYNQSCSPICPAGYLGVNRACLSCINNCNTCNGSTSHCLSCNANFYLYNTSAPTCVNPCPNGTYMNVISQMCTGCTSPCLTCFNFSNYCLTCTTGYLFDGTCIANCSIGYYILGVQCQPCPLNCSSCSSNSICLSCASGLYLYMSSCVLSCPTSSPIINSAGSCSWCSDPSCMNCSTLNYCYQCYYPKLLFQGACLSNCPTGYIMNVTLSGCQLSLSNSTNATLTSSLTSTSLFPVPFTIAATFLAVACLMSKFQYDRTYVSGSLYALYGLLEWGATIFLLLYYFVQKGKINFLAYLLICGGLALNYLLNFLFLCIQNCSLKKDRRLKGWLEGSCNSCWYYFVSFIGLIATNKFKNILFCKLFNLRILSAKLQNIGQMKVFYAYSFISFVSSLAIIGGAVIFMIDSASIIDQLFMCYIDVLILSLLNLLLAILNSRKQDNFFQDIDEDGYVMNKRIQSWDEVLNANVMPHYSVLQRTKSQKGEDSSRKLQLLQGLFEGKSFRDFSMQAQQILGQRSLISRLGTQSISELNLFGENNDMSIQMNQRDVQDVSIGMSARPPRNDVSVGNDRMQFNRSISVQMDQLHRHEISVQYAPLVTDQTVHMTKEEENLGIQCNVEQQNISIQYSAKPIFQHISEELNSDVQTSMREGNSLQHQKRQIQNRPAVQERGMKAQLELDINDKLQLKEKQLLKLQEDRRMRQKQQAVKMFQKKMAVGEENSRSDKERQKNALNMMFNNEESAIDRSSFINSRAEVVSIPFGSRQNHNSQTHTEKQFIEMLEDNKNMDAEQMNISLSRQENNLGLQSNMKVDFKMQNRVLPSQQLYIGQEQEQDATNRYELANGNTLQNYNGNSIEKSRSSTNWQTSRMPPLPKGRRPVLEPSDNEIQKSQHLQDEIINHPINPRLNLNYLDKRNLNGQNGNADKVNLTQYLRRKDRNLTSAQNLRRKNNLMDEDDALARQLETEARQQPLPRPNREYPSEALMPSALRRGSGHSSKDIQSFNMQFDNRDKIVMLQNNDELMQQTKNIQNKKNRSREMLQRSNSKKSIQRQSPTEQKNRGYMHETYSSAERRKSLQKIYLNKLVKK